MRELSRANATIIEAYTSRLAHSAFAEIEVGLGTRGFGGRLQVMQSSGGLASPSNVKAVDTLHSGPVGALVGGRYLAELYGLDNMITTDVVALIRRRIDQSWSNYHSRDPTAARMILGVPMIEVLSDRRRRRDDGANRSVDEPITGRPGVGRRNARTRMLWPRRDDPTVTDAISCSAI